MTGFKCPAATIEECDEWADRYLAEYRRGFWQYQLFLESMDCVFDRRLELMRVRDLKLTVNNPTYTWVAYG